MVQQRSPAATTRETRAQRVQPNGLRRESGEFRRQRPIAKWRARSSAGFSILTSTYFALLASSRPVSARYLSGCARRFEPDRRRLSLVDTVPPARPDASPRHAEPLSPAMVPAREELRAVSPYASSICCCRRIFLAPRPPKLKREFPMKSSSVTKISRWAK
jgi:hypothetical protein